MVARKEELRQLQEQAAAVVKVRKIAMLLNLLALVVSDPTVAFSEQKQQQTATALAEKLKELNATATANASAADEAVISTTLLAKRKLDDALNGAPSEARATKRLATALSVSTELHECTQRFDYHSDHAPKCALRRLVWTFLWCPSHESASVAHDVARLGTRSSVSNRYTLPFANSSGALSALKLMVFT